MEDIKLDYLPPPAVPRRSLSRMGLLAAIMATTPETRMLLDMAMEPVRRRERKLRNRRVWKCKKCRNEFYPNMSNSLCDECIRRRDGDTDA